MKFQKMIRVQLMMVGLGAALMLASSARAQQDMDPTTFDINPGVSQADNGAAVRTAQGSPAATEMNAEAAAVANQNDADVSQAALAQWTPTDTMVGLVLIAGMLSIVVYAAAATREHLPRISSQSGSYVPTTGATAH
jgi:hypothetical protein